MLTRETITKPFGYIVGDIKLALYDITFSQYQVVEPPQDPGWFLLNGAPISQTTYPKLYAQFGTTFNIGGEGTGNFRLPDYAGSATNQQGYFPIGRGLTNFTSYSAKGGEINHTLLQNEIYSHGHSSSLTVAANSHGHPGSSGTADNGGNHSHTHAYAYVTLELGGGTVVQVTAANYGYATSSTADGHGHNMSGWSINDNTESFLKGGGITTAGSGGNGAHNNMMPYIVIGGLLVKHD